MNEATLADIQKEIVDLKIRVNNLEKRLSRLQADVKPKSKSCDAAKYI